MGRNKQRRKEKKFCSMMEERIKSDDVPLKVEVKKVKFDTRSEERGGNQKTAVIAPSVSCMISFLISFTD